MQHVLELIMGKNKFELKKAAENRKPSPVHVCGCKRAILNVEKN